MAAFGILWVFGRSYAESGAAVLSLLALSAMGIVGVGWVWLSAQTVAAAAILLHRWRARRHATSDAG